MNLTLQLFAIAAAKRMINPRMKTRVVSGRPKPPKAIVEKIPKFKVTTDRGRRKETVGISQRMNETGWTFFTVMEQPPLVSLPICKKPLRLSRKKVETFHENKNAHTKYQQARQKFSRLKTIAYDINQIWSIDVAFVDKLARYNNGVKFLFVAVAVISCYLRVSLTRTKSSKETAKTIQRNLRKEKRQNV